MTTTEFNTKFNDLENLLMGFAMKLTKNKEKSKDLFQETAMRAFKNRKSFNQGTNFKAWVTTIMRNSFINNYRKVRTRNRVEQPVENILFIASKAVESEKASSVIMMKELNKIIDSLTDTYKVPFMMYYRGFSYIEIAEAVNLPIGTVKSRIFFARKQLKAKIEACYQGEIPMRA